MKSIRLAAALALLVGLSTSSVINPCDNDDRCVALRSTSPSLGDAPNASNFQDAKAAVRQSRTQDANGNNAISIVKSRKTGARARVGAAYAARFQAYIDDLETNYGARVFFMGGTGRAAVRVRVSIRAERL